MARTPIPPDGCTSFIIGVMWRVLLLRPEAVPADPMQAHGKVDFSISLDIRQTGSVWFCGCFDALTMP